MNIAWVERSLVVASEPTGIATYDYDFDLHFRCDHPYVFASEECCILRIGAIQDYDARYMEMLEWNLRLINSPTEHRMASELEHWYPLIHDLTPHTEVFEVLPTVGEVEGRFAWPVFLKGSRQTSRHSRFLSVIESADHYRLVYEHYRKDSILSWQKPVVRSFVPLEPVVGTLPGKVQPSMEYRSFWWHGACVGWGRYWFQVPPYDRADASVGLDVARDVASRLKVPFLVVDFARTADGRWIVIECNDAQEAGYAGAVPRLLWDKILLERPHENTLEQIAVGRMRPKA